MVFSKSFGYAVRGVLYVALMQDTRHFVQAEEIAERLAMPRHFVGKILKKLVKAGVLSSSKGKTGGFAANNETKSMALIKLFEITEGLTSFEHCALRLQQCDGAHPCPIHNQMAIMRNKIKDMLSTTTIDDLLRENKEDFINSIATVYNQNFHTNVN